MNQHVLNAAEFLRLLDDLLKPTALTELAVLAACLALAWTLTRVFSRMLGWRPSQPDADGTEQMGSVQTGSVLFGEGLIDGVMFPVLAALLGIAARRALQGMVPIALFKLAIPVLVSLALIRLTVRVLRSAFPRSDLVRAIERTVSWAAWVVVVLWITGVMPWLLEELDGVTWKIGTTTLTLRNLIEGSFSAVIVLMISLWLSSALEARLLKGAQPQDLSVRKIAANAIRAILLFVGVMLALSAAGIDLTALSVLGGAVGVGLGFGLQKLASNYVSGFVILAERSLRIGDLVKVDGFEGRITDINTRFTLIRSISGRESIVPNELLITQRVENASLADPNVLLTTSVQVAYGTDVAALRPRLVEAIAKLPRVLNDPGPGVHLSAFAADGLELTITFWIADPENSQLAARSEVNLAILQVLNAVGVEIPYPQRVVRHLPPDAVAADRSGPPPA